MEIAARWSESCVASLIIMIIISQLAQGSTELSSKMCNISRIMSANHTPEKKECSVAVSYSPNLLKTIWSCWGCLLACRSVTGLEWEMSSCSFWKWNSPSTGICLGILCSLLQAIAVMYQTCQFTIFKWLWCRIWEFMTKEVESYKSDETYFFDIKAMQ